MRIVGDDDDTVFLTGSVVGIKSVEQFNKTTQLKNETEREEGGKNTTATTGAGWCASVPNISRDNTTPE